MPARFLKNASGAARQAARTAEDTHAEVAAAAPATLLGQGVGAHVEVARDVEIEEAVAVGVEEGCRSAPAGTLKPVRAVTSLKLPSPLLR